MSANVNKYYRRVITNCPTSRQPSYWQQIYGTRLTINGRAFSGKFNPFQTFENVDHDK